MLIAYRGHIILVLQDGELTAEITERGSSEILPTKVSATLEEGLDVCIERAKALIDAYIEGKKRRES